MRAARPKCGSDAASCGDARRDEDGNAVQRLDGTDVRAWAHAATVALGAARGRIDAVNVFPVADSDTGTNVLLTVAGGADADAALARISAQHPVLAAAHVVDAGACALLVVLDALRDVIGRDGAAADAGRDLSWLQEPAGPVGAHVAPAGGGAFEVMLLVRTSGEPGERGDLGPALSTRMQELGDSVAVVGAEGVWQVHVHTDHPGRAVAAAALGA